MPLDESSQAIKDKVQVVWQLTIQFCTRILNHSGVYGFGLMLIPEPNVQQMHKLLTIGVLPILVKLADDPNIQPDDGMKIDNIRQYIRHLENIVSAIENANSEAFDAAVAALDREAML